MTAPINQASELERRKMESQCEWDAMFERLNQAQHYAPDDQEPAAAPAAIRARQNWRVLAVIVGVMLACLGKLLATWLAAGTWLR